MHSRTSSRSPHPQKIDKLDFDVNRRPTSRGHDSLYSETSRPSRSLLRDDESFFSDIVDGVIERDRRKMQRLVIKYASFACAILNCLCAGSITAYSLYGPLFLKHLRYTQFQVNAVSTTAELAMYLPVPLFGYLCDRYNPRPLSLASAIFFGAGYLLAALTYRAGPPSMEDGWPFSAMVVAFIGVGCGTVSMYLSALTTCAKNFGRGTHKGLALAIPIAAFGLSGMWQSQVGNHFFTPRDEQGRKEDTDVYRYFLFLAGLLFAVGVIGAVGLRVVDEEELIDEAVEDLERSGLLEESPLFQHYPIHDADHPNGYGTLPPTSPQSTTSLHHPPTATAAKKTFLLNTETRLFLSDPTMWLLAAGFFLTTGPGEAFVNNVGTIIQTLYPPPFPTPPSSNSPATHVSIIALTSTFARLLTGTLSDLLAPTPEQKPHHQHKHKRTISRLVFLLLATALFSLGQVLLASSLIQLHPAAFPAVSALVGFGYGAIFSLVPIIVSVVWGVENFGTNWGIVAVVPAAGAAIWGAVYSAVYQAGVERGSVRSGAGGDEDEQMCYGAKCYRTTFWAMAACSWVAIALWVMAWRGWRRRDIAV